MAIQNYRSDIDGLRGLAVLPVVLYHAGTPAVSGGYIGVDVFFVISGYLITGFIGREIDDQRFSLIHFYERRARRILPALFTVILASIIAASFLMMPFLFEKFARSVLATTLFYSNIYFWSSIDYFSTAAEYMPLLHTWSLAVEEQYYVFWPLFLMLAAKFPRRFLVVAVIALFLISLAGSIAGPEYYRKANFYLIPTRIWELMCGAVLALGVIPSWRNERFQEASALVGIMMILLPMVIYDSTTPFPGAAALWPCLGTTLVIHSGGATQIGRLLSYTPVVFLGLISYSLYLWHWPILALLRISSGTVELPASVAFIAVLASVGLATLSWKVVERPFRQRGLITRRTIFSLSGVGIATGVLLSLAIVAGAGLPYRFPGPVLAIAAGREDIESNRKSCMNKRPRDGLCRIGVQNKSVSVLFWGDSHASALMSAVDVALKSASKAGYIASRRACAPLMEVRREEYNWRSCVRFNDAIADLVESGETEIDTVILAARWALNATGERPHGEAGLDVRLVSMNGVTGADNGELFRLGLGALVARLRRAGVRVVLLGGVPEIGWDVPLTMASRLQFGLPPRDAPTLSDVQERNAEADAVLIQTAATHGAEFVPIAPLLCQPVCQIMDGNRPVYVDDDHLSAHGARHVLGPKLGGKIWRPADPSGHIR